ncbi:MAG: hypothetical protein HKN07_06455 [Acidimicrobiia bacterium]|nr:hypothetical protein [Acidimicrobiia bacterium]NNF63883.1 hypothetical protein [Acidimicrobiia bacterium]
MTVKKISIALDPHVASAASDAAQRKGLSLSAWLNEAASRALQIDDGLAAVSAYEVEYGQLSDDSLDEADALLDQTLGPHET